MEKSFLVTRHLDGSTYASFAPDLPDRVGEKFDIGQPDGSTSAGYIVSANSPEDAIWQAAQAQAIADFLKAHEKGFQCLESNFDQCIHVDDFEVAGWAEFATSDKSVEELITEEKNAQIAASRLLAEAGVKSVISDRILAISDNGTFAEWMKPEARVCYPDWRIEDPFGILEKNNGQEYNPGTTES